MNMRGMFPEDTRGIELVSGLSLMVLLFLTPYKQRYEIFADGPTWHYWYIIAGILGVLQIYSIVKERLDVLRILSSWFAGAYWIWYGVLEMISTSVDPNSPIPLILGFGCMYAFIVNLLFLSKKWS